MKRKFKRALAVLIAATTMAVGMSALSASAGNSQGWYVQRISGSPSTVDKAEYSGTVTGLVNGTDSGITFTCSTYSDTNSVGYVGLGDIEDSVKLYPNVYAIMNYSGKTSTCLFVNNWYALTGSTCNFTVTSCKYNSSTGSYVSYFNASNPFRISGTAS